MAVPPVIADGMATSEILTARQVVERGALCVSSNIGTPATSVAHACADECNCALKGIESSIAEQATTSSRSEGRRKPQTLPAAGGSIDVKHATGRNRRMMLKPSLASLIQVRHAIKEHRFQRA
ncbi:hypothetical protein [Paraburkholderia sp. CI3]|uniref:hypothetical protein n=1 Tax=Paraburkholderia sp. CI3 TaxID=2991060 RepID=UPI003D2057C4